MSFAAHVWASGVAPIANVYEYAVLNRMADEVDESGEGCCLSTPTIANDIMSDGRSVRRALDSLIERKLICEGDQRRAAYIRADRRPVVYDLLIPAECFADLRRTNERRAAQGRAAITPENRPVQGPPPEDARRKRRADVGMPRLKKIGNDQTEQDELDAAEAAGEALEENGVSTSHPATGGLSDTPSATGGLVVQDGVTSSPGRGVYQSPDPEVLPELPNPTSQDPPLSELHSLPRDASPLEQGGNLTEQEKAQLSAALDEAFTVRAGDRAWHRQAVFDAMQRELAAGTAASSVATAIVAAAKDGSTNYPGRIGYLLRQGSTADDGAPGPAWARGPVKYLDPATPMCRVVGHRGEPADRCGKCKADAIAARLDEPEPSPRPEEAEGLTGRELARRMAAASRGPAPMPRATAATSASAPPAPGAEQLVTAGG